MNRRYNLIILFFMICIITGCDSNKSLIINKIDVQDIEKIQVVTAMGNLEYGAKSKIITDLSEITLLVDVFNNALIGDEVKEDDVVVSDTSEHLFYNDNNVVLKFSFNGNDSERIWYNSKWHYIEYKDKSAYDMYKSSEVDVIIVNKDLEEMERQPTRITSEQVKLISSDMKYDDIIKVLGDTIDLGSGVHVLAYIVDDNQSLLTISLMGKDTPCGKTGEELLKTLK